MAADNSTLVHGTLDLLVLRVLSWGDNHGYGIARWIKDGTTQEVMVEDRALYLSLHRLEERRWITSEWGLSSNNRKARYYRLTATGRKQLREHIARWRRYVGAVSDIIEREEALAT
jgi:PadR family transcriptional regulator PadR